MYIHISSEKKKEMKISKYNITQEEKDFLLKFLAVADDNGSVEPSEYKRIETEIEEDAGEPVEKPEKKDPKKHANFQTKNINGFVQSNEYVCMDCLKAGIEHEVKTGVPHGYTDRSSCWGPGVPTTIHECTGCGCWNGPWVSADIVGGGY
ncbi:MAG: hypothetical protein HOG49_28800 [Candidatus Scalindua sp.]|jgi:hypothetical protein|nr:hypothetical protein [Candidatus Scalindua sp.]